MVNLNNKTSDEVKKRIIFNLIILGAVFYTPWWFVAILAFIGAYSYNQYYEIILIGALMDLLYGASSLPLGGIYGLLGAIVIFLTATYTKNSVRKV